MFGGKKLKEAQDKIQELEVVQKRYRQFGEDIENVKTSSDEVFATLEKQDVQVDQGLNHVIGMVKEEQEQIRTITEQTANMMSALEVMESKFGEIQADAIKRDETEKFLLETIDLCTKISEEEQSKLENGRRAFEESFAEMNNMQDAAKSMTTFSLNAAIEAGKLGEAGLPFLQAADNMRKLSEEYSKMLAELQNQMQTLQTQFMDQKNLLQLTEVLQKTQEAAGTVKDMESEKQDMDLTEQIRIQQDVVKNMEESLCKKETNYRIILEQMEVIEQNHADSRTAKGKLEEILALLYGKTL